MIRRRFPQFAGADCVGRSVSPPMSQDIVDQLERRFGRLHSRQRLGIEDDHEARAGGRRTASFGRDDGI